MLLRGPVAQWIRHRATGPGIVGSSPTRIICVRLCFCPCADVPLQTRLRSGRSAGTQTHLAALAASRIGRKEVLGSIPSAALLPRGRDLNLQFLEAAFWPQECPQSSLHISLGCFDQKTRKPDLEIYAQVILSQIWQCTSPPQHHFWPEQNANMQHSTHVGSAPTRENPIGLAGGRLSCSAKVKCLVP